jgi:hypothetical protein
MSFSRTKNKSPGATRALKSRVALAGAIYRLKVPIRDCLGSVLPGLDNFPSIASPDARKPPGRPETDRPDPETPPTPDTFEVRKVFRFIRFHRFQFFLEIRFRCYGR